MLPFDLKSQKVKGQFSWNRFNHTSATSCFGQLADSRTTCCHFAVTWHMCQMHWYGLNDRPVCCFDTHFLNWHVLCYTLPMCYPFLQCIYLQRDFTYYTEPLFRRGKMAAITTSLHTGKYQLLVGYLPNSKDGAGDDEGWRRQWAEQELGWRSCNSSTTSWFQKCFRGRSFH